MCIPENASILKEFGAANAILNAMSRYPTHAAILTSAAETLKPIVTVADVGEIVELLRQMIPPVASGDSRVANSAASLRLLAERFNAGFLQEGRAGGRVGAAGSRG